MVDLDPMVEEEDIHYLKSMIQSHFDYTSSKRAKSILDNWSQEIKNFIKVIPRDYKKALASQKAEDSKPASKEGVALHG
jgi:glutamate synthase (NADPH/NADH) large chain